MSAMELLDAHERPVRMSPLKILFGVFVVATFGIWAYAYSGLADRPLPDRLDEPGFAARAEPRCAAALEQLDTLEPAHLATDHRDRARTIVEANGILVAMVGDLDGLVDGTPRDQQILRDWLGDWRVYLGNRADYAVRLDLDPRARFYQSDVANELLDRRISRLADTNAMPSCGVPGDVG